MPATASSCEGRYIAVSAHPVNAKIIGLTSMLGTQDRLEYKMEVMLYA
jgi:hypothetical protein